MAQLGVLIAISGVCGCTRQDQKSVARRLSEADRVVFTNPDNGATMTVTNGQVKKLVEALEASQEIPLKRNEALTITSGYTLDFFKGTNRLATIPTSHMIFWIGKTPYEDKSGTLLALDRTASEQLRPNPLAP